jgi:haloalkane dehalogenase
MTTTSPSAFTEKRINLPTVGFSTRLLTAGAGVPVLLLHGNPHSAGEWRFLAEALGGKVLSLAPDLPGFGAGDEPPESFDYSHAAHEAFLDDVLAVEKVTEPIVLVVHDIGGVVGLQWAEKHIDRIRGLVITNTVIFEGFPWFPTAHTWKRTDGLGKARAEVGMWLLGQAGGALFRRVFGRISPELNEEEIQLITKEFALDKKSKRSTLRLFRQMIQPEYLIGHDAALRKLIESVPVRVVWGLGDPYIPDEYADKFPGLPAEKRLKIPGGGHWVTVTHPKEVAEAIRQVIAER